MSCLLIFGQTIKKQDKTNQTNEKQTPPTQHSLRKHTHHAFQASPPLPHIMTCAQTRTQTLPLLVNEWSSICYGLRGRSVCFQFTEPGAAYEDCFYCCFSCIHNWKSTNESRSGCATYVLTQYQLIPSSPRWVRRSFISSSPPIRHCSDQIKVHAN